VDLLPRVSGFHWFAAADVLLSDRAPDLAAHLIHTIRLQLTVYVTDRDGIELGAGGMSGGGAGAVGEDPPDYPPHAEYRFELAPSPGFFVLASGPHPSITRERSRAAFSTLCRLRTSAAQATKTVWRTCARCRLKQEANPSAR
jgi:hypothetical protein